MASDRAETSRARRVIAFYLTGVVTFLALVIAGSVMGVTVTGTTLSGYSLPGLVFSAATAYYLVYRGGYERLRRLLS